MIQYCTVVVGFISFTYRPVQTRESRRDQTSTHQSNRTQEAQADNTLERNVHERVIQLPGDQPTQLTSYFRSPSKQQRVSHPPNQLFVSRDRYHDLNSFARFKPHPRRIYSDSQGVCQSLTTWVQQKHNLAVIE